MPRSACGYFAHINPKTMVLEPVKKPPSSARAGFAQHCILRLVYKGLGRPARAGTRLPVCCGRQQSRNPDGVAPACASGSQAEGLPGQQQDQSDGAERRQCLVGVSESQAQIRIPQSSLQLLTSGKGFGRTDRYGSYAGSLLMRVSAWCALCQCLALRLVLCLFHNADSKNQRRDD